MKGLLFRRNTNNLAFLVSVKETSLTSGGNHALAVLRDVKASILNLIRYTHALAVDLLQNEVHGQEDGHGHDEGVDTGEADACDLDAELFWVAVEGA